MLPLALIALGLLALLGGAEFVVRGASRLARRLGVPPIVIGLTVVSIGTSAPELAVGVQAAIDGAGGLAVGNIAGTNVVNLLFILGLSALIRPLALDARTIRLDLPMMAVAALMLLPMAFDGVLSRTDGVMLLAVAAAYTGVIVQVSRRERAAVLAEFAADYPAPEDREAQEVQRGVLVESLALTAGIVVIVAGAHWLVAGAVDLARQLGVTNALIGLTVVAIGTSAPELATTLISTFRGDRDVAIGNLLGSSVYNIALILGVTAVVAPAGVTMGTDLITVDLPVMAAAALLCLPVFLTGRQVDRREGGLFVAAYVGYLTYLMATRV